MADKVSNQVGLEIVSSIRQTGLPSITVMTKTYFRGIDVEKAIYYREDVDYIMDYMET